MSLFMDLAVVLALINAVLLFSLFIVYFQNYRKLRASISLGLAIFSIVFIIQKLASALVFFVLMSDLHELGIPMFVLELLQLLGISILIWITYN